MPNKTSGRLVMVCCWLVLAPVIASAECNYDLNGVGYGYNGSVCPYRGPNGGNSNYDAGAAQRAQAAAAAAVEEQRRRNAELEQQRIDAEKKRRADAIAKQKKFENDRDAAAGTLRGSAASGGSGSAELRGSSAATGLRGSGNAGDMDAEVLKGAGLMGSNVVVPKGDANAGTAIRKGSPTDSGSQLKSTEYHGRAAQVGGSERAHAQAGKGFDTVGEDRGTLPVRAAPRDRTPSGLAAKIPSKAWEKDPTIGTLFGYYEKLGATKADTLASIAEIKQRQKIGKEEPTVSSAQLSALSTKLKDLDKDQDKTEKSLKEHVINLGMVWNEGGTGATGQQTADKK